MRFFVALLVILSLFTGCDEKKSDEQTSNSETVKEETKQDLSTFTLHTLDGTSLVLHKKEKGFSFETLEHKAVLITFFTTWCPPCKGQIPHLINLKNRYPNDFEIIGVILEEKKPDHEVAEFARENNINFILTNSQENFALSNHIGDVKSIPYMILYDKDGEYFKHYIGAIPEEMLEVDLKKVL